MQWQRAEFLGASDEPLDFDFPENPKWIAKRFSNLNRKTYEKRCFWSLCLCVLVYAYVRFLIPSLSEHGTWHGNAWLGENRFHLVMEMQLHWACQRMRFAARCIFRADQWGLQPVGHAWTRTHATENAGWNAIVMSDRMLETKSHRMWEYMSVKMPEGMSDRISKYIPERMPDRMSQYM